MRRFFKKNDCAGQGDCATAKAHTCGGENDCAGLGGCGAHPGENKCKGMGDCHVPLADTGSLAASARQPYLSRACCSHRYTNSSSRRLIQIAPCLLTRKAA